MTALSADNPTSLNADRARKDFPALGMTVRGKPLVYLDNGASTQKPEVVIEGMSEFYRKTYANVHRGAYWLSEKATDEFEKVRTKVKKFINAPSIEEIIFVKGATEGLNLIASSFTQAFLKAGDEILITAMEHHSNIVPWQMACERFGAKLRVVPMDKRGVLDLAELEKLLSEQTKLLSLTHVSNALGTINPVKDIIAKAHAKNIPVMVDGAQAVPHMPVDVQDLDCDFYVFSGHKVYGPTGSGILFGKRKWLDQIPPYQGGGDMIRSVTFEKTEYNVLPYKFEAGTPDIVAMYGLGLALEYVQGLGMASISKHEEELLSYATQKVKELPEITIIGTAPHKAGVLSMTVEGVHPHDIATILDSEGIAVRAGHHCAQPVMDFFGVPATARASFGLYNTTQDVDALVEGLKKVIKMFS